jgi:hypothetical protein
VAPVHGGTGALRHAGHGSGLRVVAVLLGQVDQPVGEHTAAFAAHRQDRNRDAMLMSPPAFYFV